MTNEKVRHEMKHHHDHHSSTIELVIFNVGEIVCALKTIEVLEIIKKPELTVVHHAPEFVSGVINLRGQIVTIIDMRTKFVFPSSEKDEQQIIVVKMGEESVGLQIDNVDDILIADTADIEPPPSNISGLRGAFFSGIYKKKDALVAILNLDEILKLDN
jgi:purine-binding chemotaxis protein CheW